MATGWVKSLQCKSRAFEDVFQPNPKSLNLLLPNSGCTRSDRSLKDVVQSKAKKKRPHRPTPASPSPLSTPNRSLKSRLRPSPGPDSYFPSLTELPEGHSSRNVVEIIFRTSWSEKAFPGTIEMMFKVHNPAATATRFEEYREAVKTRASAAAAAGGGLGSRRENSRCAADGNEVMRFHCVGPAVGGVCDAFGLCTFSGKGAAIRTFAGSGGAHGSVRGGAGKGRRAMLVCRVIAGRVCKGVESFLDGGVVGGAVSGGFDSVGGEDDSLIVFDSRALLPCFLIIYKV
ncbi:hypothetical protein H6P81_005289 [Aristolochia fimbriata]|uniref:Uncharacterized protein n=1 Tax=Aristolochia fimbriata TaxID=158543 RepID=A0AAV7EU02_ARIFI|nr:hypothetical protein H6P81_005289 [Aristolochia fimbriata]